MDLGIYVHGLCAPTNPGGTVCYGYVIWGLAPVGQSVEGNNAFDSDTGTTNDIAEWVALGKVLAVLVAEKLRPDSVTIYSDSKLVIHQLVGDWLCNKDRLRQFRERCIELLTVLDCKWKAHWVPREQNTQADRLARAAYVGRVGRLLPERVKS